MKAVGARQNSAPLRRANESFRQALLHWAPEERLLGGEFLYIAAETLSRYLLASRAGDRGLNPRGLARVEGETKTEKLRRSILVEIFGGREDILRALEAASNGFEHGYMATSSVRERMEPVLDDALACVREALIRAAGVDDKTVSALLCDDYSEPRPLIPELHLLEGSLSRTDDAAGSSDEDLAWGVIDLTWRNVSTVATEREGEIHYAFNAEVEVSKLPENVSLETRRYGLRAAYISPVGESMEAEATARGQQEAEFSTPEIPFDDNS